MSPGGWFFGAPTPHSGDLGRVIEGVVVDPAVAVGAARGAVAVGCAAPAPAVAVGCGEGASAVTVAGGAAVGASSSPPPHAAKASSTATMARRALIGAHDDSRGSHFD